MKLSTEYTIGRNAANATMMTKASLVQAKAHAARILATLTAAEQAHYDNAPAEVRLQLQVAHMATTSLAMSLRTAGACFTEELALAVGMECAS